jgi:Glycosyl transferase family 64 domain
MRSLCDYRLIIPWAVLGLSLLIWTLVSEPLLIMRRLHQPSRHSEDEDATNSALILPASSPSFDNKHYSSSASSYLPNITVIIMNYNRPDVLQHSSLVPTLLQHPAVTEILLLHANPATAFVFEHDKIQNIDASDINDQIGLALRFHYCRKATNEFVLHIDDDMEIIGNGDNHHEDDAISILQRHLAHDPRRIVGHHARSYDYWRVPYRHGYRNDKEQYGLTPVVLTKFLMVHQKTCHLFFEYASLMDDMALSSKPKWNGEDIFINLVVSHIHDGLLNLAVNVSVREAALIGATHAGVSGASILATSVHAYYRGQFWATAVQRLNDATMMKQQQQQQQKLQTFIK